MTMQELRSSPPLPALGSLRGPLSCRVVLERNLPLVTATLLPHPLPSLAQHGWLSVSLAGDWVHPRYPGPCFFHSQCSWLVGWGRVGAVVVHFYVTLSGFPFPWSKLQPLWWRGVSVEQLPPTL